MDDDTAAGHRRVIGDGRGRSGDALYSPEANGRSPRNAMRQTMPPRSSSSHTAGFVHIGKTGGSTISSLLRNGCNSFETGPCRNITHESAVSRIVEHYYHVPDFWRLPESNHNIYIVSVRDPYDRAVSAFLFHHPENVKYFQLKLTKREKYYAPLAYRCFPTLESFASLLSSHGGNQPSSCNYPYPKNVIEPENCAALACATIHGLIRLVFTHFFFNYRNILDTKIPTEPERITFALRQERLWNDWTSLNQMLGQTETVVIPTGDKASYRNVSGWKLPVTRQISEEGRRKLCWALEPEYFAYFRFIQRARNLDENDLEDCKKVAARNCPVIDLDSMLRAVANERQS